MSDSIPRPSQETSSEDSRPIPGTAPGETGSGISEMETLAPATGVDGSPHAPPVGYGFLAPAQTPEEMGRLGPYRVLRMLGSGGMGMVLLAEDPQLQRQLALKVMKPSVASDPSTRERFLQEARAMASVEHDNVITIHQVDEANGVPFLAMPLLKGESLDERLKRTGSVPLMDAVRMGREIAQGLAAAHAQSLIHRDIKPANVWLEEENDRVRIVDFGLARAVDGGAKLTQSGAIVGTPAYMAPEQINGEELDNRCDLFSLGCVLYQLVTGKSPFYRRDTISTLTAVGTDHPDAPDRLNPDVSEKISSLVMRLLEKKRENRPESAQQVAEELEFLERKLTRGTEESDTELVPNGASPSAQQTQELRTSATQTMSSGPSSRRWLLAGLVGVLILGAVVAAVVLRIKTPKGTLVIESEDPNVQILVKKDGAVILDKTRQREIELKVGDYEIELIEKNGLRLSTKSFTINDNGKTVVKVTLEPVKKGKEPPGGVKILKRSPFDDLDPKDIPPEELRNAGDGDPTKAPKDLVAIWGESRLRTWGGYLSAIVFSPDGKHIATSAEYDPSTRIWDAKTGELQRVLPHGTGCFSVAYSPDGKQLATVGAHREADNINLWDPTTGKKIRTFQGDESGSRAVAFSPDGRQLIVGGVGGDLWVWNAETGKLVRKVNGHKGGILDVAASPDGKWLASAGYSDHTVKIWDAQTGKEVHSLKQEGSVYRVAFHPDRKQISIGSKDNCSLWDIGDGKPQLVKSLPGFSAGMAYGPPGSSLLAYGGGTKIIHDLSKDMERYRFPHGSASGGVVAFSPDGKTFTCSQRSRLKMWDLSTGAELLKPRHHTNALRVLTVRADGEQVISSANFDSTHVWKTTDGSASVLPGIDHCRRYSPDGKLAVLDSYQGYKVLDAHRRQTIWIGGKKGPRDAVFSPDSQLLAVALNEGGILLLEAATGKKRQTLADNEKGIHSLSFSPDGKRLAKAGVEGVKIWDLTTGKETGKWTERGINTGKVAFSPLGDRLSCLDKHQRTIWFLHPETAQPLRGGLAGHQAGIFDLDWSPDGAQFATIDALGRVILWDAAKALPVREWQLGGICLTLAFSPEGRHLLTGNGNGTIYVLRLKNE